MVTNGVVSNVGTTGEDLILDPCSIFSRVCRSNGVEELAGVLGVLVLLGGLRETGVLQGWRGRKTLLRSLVDWCLCRGRRGRRRS